MPDIHLDIPASARSEHDWGYSESDKKNYIVHSKRFYQLFSSRYTYRSLSPYMIKLVDHVLELVDTLPFLLARFQSETAEHANYEHNTNYYHHTTGGKGKHDPIFAQFQAIWIGIYYEITIVKASEMLHEEPVSSDFVKYCLLL